MSSNSNKHCRKTKIAIVRDIMKGTEIRKLETDEEETKKLASTLKNIAGEISFYLLNFSLYSNNSHTHKLSPWFISRHRIDSQ